MEGTGIGTGIRIQRERLGIRGRGNFFDGLVRQSCRSAFGASRISPM